MIFQSRQGPQIACVGLFDRLYPGLALFSNPPELGDQIRAYLFNLFYPSHCEYLHFSPVFQGFRDGDFIGELDVAAYGDAHGDAGYFHS